MLRFLRARLRQTLPIVRNNSHLSSSHVDNNSHLACKANCEDSLFSMNTEKSTVLPDSASCHLIITPTIFKESGFETIRCNILLAQQNTCQLNLKDACVFRTTHLRYEPFCDDFGPMSLLSVTKFITALDHEIASTKASNIIYCVEQGARNLTNGAFLLGAYMILKLEREPHEVLDCFNALASDFEGYRDATFCTNTFRLLLIDCWSGIHRAKSLQWIAMPSSTNPDMWGQIDVAEYERYDHSLNGDLHVVVPGRFVAFRAPTHIHGRKYKDNYSGDRFVSRDFAPQYYSEIFETLGVAAVVRLNEASYPRREFTDRGFDHHDLFFDDCTTPPAAIVARFFEVTDRARGLVAVHCKAGLGRTGTLVALSLIRSHGFSARGAIGWLRVMRPGAVIGEQQQFLCAVEARLLSPPVPRRTVTPPDTSPCTSSGTSPGTSPSSGAVPHGAAAPGWGGSPAPTAAKCVSPTVTGTSPGPCMTPVTSLSAVASTVPRCAAAPGGGGFLPGWTVTSMMTGTSPGTSPSAGACAVPHAPAPGAAAPPQRRQVRFLLPVPGRPHSVPAPRAGSLSESAAIGAATATGRPAPPAHSSPPAQRPRGAALLCVRGSSSNPRANMDFPGLGDTESPPVRIPEPLLPAPGDEGSLMSAAPRRLDSAGRRRDTEPAGAFDQRRQPTSRFDQQFDQPFDQLFDRSPEALAAEVSAAAERRAAAIVARVRPA